MLFIFHYLDTWRYDSPHIHVVSWHAEIAKAIQLNYNTYSSFDENIFWGKFGVTKVQMKFF